MKYIELKVNLPKDYAESFTEFLDILEVEGYYEILFDSSLPKPVGQILRDDTNIKVYLGELDLEKEIKINIFLKTLSIENIYIESRPIETKDYEEAYKEFYKPFQIGKDFWIVPVWEKETYPIGENKILYMNPGFAFGTGHHETTKLMLSRMQELDLVNSQILDLGTGSGILSIGAASLGAQKIVAIDIDSNAVRATEFNWTQNTFPQKIDFQVLQGSFDHADIFPSEYDLVLANITFAVISMNIEYLKNLKAKKFLFSGLIIEKKEDSLNLFETHLGGKLNYFEQFNDWILIEWIR